MPGADDLIQKGQYPPVKTPKPKIEKAKKPTYSTLQNVWFMVKLAWTAKEKKVLVLCLLSAVLAVLNSIIGLYITPTILSAVEQRVPVSELVLTILLFTGGVMLVSAASAYVQRNTLFGRVAVRCELIALVNKKAATTSYPNVGDEAFGRLLASAEDATNSNQKAGEAIWETLSSLLKNLLGFAIYLSLLVSVGPTLLLCVLLTTVVGYYIGRYADGYRYRHREEEEDCLRHIEYIHGRAQDWNAAKDIRIFGLRGWMTDLSQKARAAYAGVRRRATRAVIFARLADVVLAFLRNGLAYVYLIRQVLEGQIDVPRFLLLFSAVGGFTEWVSGILGDLATLHRQSLDLCTLREFLDFPEPFLFTQGQPLAAEPGDAHEIRLEHVCFRYPGTEKDTLHDINLVLHPGEKLAVVGLNGAGKTTLVKLICGFLDPTEGQVLLDGTDIRVYDRAAYYRLFSAVFQQYSLLAATVAANVAQTEDNIDLPRVQACLEKAGLTGKIDSLPQGYDTLLNREVYEDAAMLSGGETQRLMLARALYKDAPFVILDEPTAALDPLAEEDLYRKYSEMTDRKSSVYISHRLASTRFCDRIILIDGNVVAEQGTHEQLLAMGGRYADLFEVQSKYYREGGDAE